MDLASSGYNASMIKRAVQTVKQAAKRAVISLARDISYYGLLPATYRKAASQPINPRKVVFVVEKGEGVPSAYSVIYPYMRDYYDLDISFVHIGINAGVGRKERLQRAMQLAREVATAHIVFLDDASREISSLPIRKGTTVV